MKITGTAALLVALCALRAQAGEAAVPDPLRDEPGQSQSTAISATPAYRFVEGMSDGVFNFMRLHVIGAIMPRTLTRSLKAAPVEGSAPLFNATLEENETRFMARARLDYPLIAAGDRPIDGAQLDAWRSWVKSEQIGVAVDSLKSTLVSRYQFELFGQATSAYAKDRRNWDPGFLSMAGILGGGFLYFNGMHATANLGALKLGVDLAAGLKLRQALQSGGNAHNLAGLELGYKDSPLTLAGEWGLTAGRMKNERVGVNYRLRF